MKKYLLLILMGLGSINTLARQDFVNFVDSLMNRGANPVFTEQKINEVIQNYVEATEDPFGVGSMILRNGPHSHGYPNQSLIVRGTILDWFLFTKQVIEKLTHAKEVHASSRLLDMPNIEHVETVIKLLQEAGFKQTISAANLNLLAQVALCECFHIDFTLLMDVLIDMEVVYKQSLGINSLKNLF